MKRLSKAGWKFLFSGKGFSVRTGQYVSESILIGAITGLVVVLFRYLIELGDFAFAALPSGKWRVVLPAIGALLGYLLIKRFSSVDTARGTDSAIRAYHLSNGYVPPAVLPVKSVASVLTVASGGSAGYEGPVTLLGAAVGSLVSRLLNLTVRARRILMAAGLAAGIAALFEAPLAGAIFGFEIFYSSSDIEYETVLPSFIASAVSYTIFACFFGWGSLFVMPSMPAFDSPIRLLPYTALALVIVFGVRFYISSFRAVEKLFSLVELGGWEKVMLGGFATGVIGLMVPDILGTSYGVIQETLTAGEASEYASYEALTIGGSLLLFFAKAIATSFTVGSGGSGGVFAPAIVCGGSLGASVGLIFARYLPASVGISPAAFALVGMAGFMASAIRIPLTAIVMVAEISGNHSLLVPAMFVCGLSFWLNNGWSLYRSQVHSRMSSLAHS